MRKDSQKTEKTNKSTKGTADARSSRGIDYRGVQDAASTLADWLADLASEDIKGWREGERRVREVREYVHAKIHGEDIDAPSEDAMIFVGTQLARAFASDPRVVAAFEAVSRSIEPLIPSLLASLARSAPTCATPPFMVATPHGAMPVPIRPPGVPLTVRSPLKPSTPAARCIHLRRV